MSGSAAVEAGGPACAERADDLAHLVYRITWKFMHSDPTLAQRMRAAAITLAACLRARDRGVAAGWLASQAAVALGELECCAHLGRRIGVLGETDRRRMDALREEVSQAVAREVGEAAAAAVPHPKGGGR
ncbi:MAG: hypothetical protein QN173_09030 [Armatimonadota bacterium]|nr:hypothetical protein [Armatimonadota bacterium]MDR7401506.1 hypothetical protein [Armatimonadota bacterium]MDR7404582.1 hypothetical protein [Armatimonadota bacterium]MDR7437545.1 hypothetical protein [Armatimonadota bacterium]MDR7471686.1 hypothetical protein [Armatimonadota bacterium]